MSSNTKKLKSQKFNLTAAIWIAITAVIIAVITVILITALRFPIIYVYFAQGLAEVNNPTKQLVTIMPSFVADEHLKKLSEEASSGYLGGEPSISYTYEGRQTVTKLRDDVKIFLIKNGYSLTNESNFHQPTGDSKAAEDYIQLSSINNKGDQVEVLISNRKRDLENLHLADDSVFLSIEFISKK